MAGTVAGIGLHYLKLYIQRTLSIDGESPHKIKLEAHGDPADGVLSSNLDFDSLGDRFSDRDIPSPSTTDSRSNDGRPLRYGNGKPLGRDGLMKTTILEEEDSSEY